MKRIYLTMLVGLLLIGIVYAEQSGGVLIGKQNDCLQIPQECTSCSGVTLTSIQYPNMSRSYINAAMTKQGSSYNYSFCDTSNLGNYIYCTTGDVDGTDTTACKDFEITSSGDNYTTSDSITNVALIIFFFLLILGVYVLNKNIDFDKWNNSIIAKYENKNYVKLVLSSITYNIMKNSFVIYYILILPILLLIMNIAYTSSNVSMIQFLPSLIVVYLVGFIIIGIYFFGYVQEWLMNLLEEFRNSNWGVGQ